MTDIELAKRLSDDPRSMRVGRFVAIFMAHKYGLTLDEWMSISSNDRLEKMNAADDSELDNAFETFTASKLTARAHRGWETRRGRTK